MSYIKMTNPGTFDIIKSLSLMGASVKTTDTPIGLFGSGSKYALAQAARLHIPITIVGEQILQLTTTKDSFRGKEFDIVSLRNEKTGEVFPTGTTTEFGKEDWNDVWFIFREFYSNMLDEGGTASVVDSIDELETGTSVYLPLEVFEDIWDNLPNYFNFQPNHTFRDGTGLVFKEGVFVGKLELPFDSWVNEVPITEVRTLKRLESLNKIAHFLLLEPNREAIQWLLQRRRWVKWMRWGLPLGY